MKEKKEKPEGWDVVPSGKINPKSVNPELVGDLDLTKEPETELSAEDKSKLLDQLKTIRAIENNDTNAITGILENTMTVKTTKLPEIDDIKGLIPKNSVMQAVYDAFLKRDIDPEPALISTLIVGSIYMGNRFYINNPIGPVVPNMYLMLVGATGSHKDIILNSIKELCNNSYWANQHYVEKSKNKETLKTSHLKKVSLSLANRTSQSQLYDELFLKHFGYISISEYSKYMVMRDSDPSNLDAMLLPLFNAHWDYREAFKNKGVIGSLSIKFPAPVVIAGIQPHLYMSNIKDRIDNGFLARVLHVPLNRKQRKLMSEMTDVSASYEFAKTQLMARFERDLADDFDEDGNDVKKLDLTSDYHQRLEYTDDALEVYDTEYVKLYNKFSSGDDELLFTQANKLLGEMPWKIAMVMAYLRDEIGSVSTAPFQVEKEDMVRAFSIIEYLIKTTDWVLGSKTTITFDEQIVIEFLKTHPGEHSIRDMKHSSRKFKRISDKDLRDILCKYVKNNLIAQTQDGKTINYSYRF